MKEAYYFSHDSNAHKDPKVLKLRAKYGWEGYGVFWAVIETLREQENYKWLANDKEILSYSFANGEPLVNEIIDYCINIGLLVDDGEHIYSESLLKRMNVYEEKRNKRVEAGKIGAQKRWHNNEYEGNQKQPNSNANGNANGNAIAKDGKGKESKVKENKINKDIYTVFQYWNDKQIIRHRQMNQSLESTINARLKDYELDEIQRAIDNYASILASEFHYWSHKWTLKEFLNPRNLDRFLDENKPFDNFRNSEEKKKPKQKAASGYWHQW